MGFRLIGYDEAVDTLWEENCFTEAALLAEPLAKHLAAPFTAQLERIGALRQEQWECWRTEKKTASGVIKGNYYLDITVDDVSRAKITDLRKKNRSWNDRKTRNSPEYLGYFPIPAYSIIKLGLESELPYVRPWLRRLEGETSEELKELLARLTLEILNGEQAVKLRAEAEEATALHRVRQINPFIDSMNKLRTDTYGKLLQISQANDLSRDWADLFFQASQATTPNRAEGRGMSRALFTILEARKLEVNDEQRAFISKNTDLTLFDTWIIKALTATATSEVLGD